MLTRTKFLLFLFVIQCPPSLLIPLAQKDVVSTSNTNNLLVLGPNQIEQIPPNSSKVTELIQQIDVKDDENHVISNINHVVVSNENIQIDNNRRLDNGPNNVVVKSVLAQTGNVSSVLNTTGVSNPLNDSSSLFLTNSSGSTLQTENITIQGLQNKLANETKTNPLNTTNNTNVNNATIKKISAVQNGSSSNVNMSSTLVPYISGGTTISIGTENVASLNSNLSSGLENEETGVPTLETSDGENTLHESLNDAELEMAWRSDIPVGRNKKAIKHIAKLDSHNATLHANNINGSINNNNSHLLDSQNNDVKRIFVILNSGNIDSLSVNSLANSDNLQSNLENNTIENRNSNNSILLNDFINSTINYVLSKILQQNQSIFLLVNSGSISNVHISSPVLENIFKNTTLKNRSKRHLNESNTNDTNVESITLKSSSDKSNDIKFRTGENQGTQNNVNHVGTIAIDNKQNNYSLVSNALDNATLVNSNATLVDLIKDEEISNAETPSFRSLIPEKIRKLQKVSNVVNNELNEIKDHNLILKLSPETPPTSFDLNQIPINNLLGGALSFIKRLKRNTHDKSENSYPWKTKQIDDHHSAKSCEKSISFNNDLNLRTIPTRKKFDDSISNVLKLYDHVELVCPLSVIVKIFTHQVLDNLAKNNADGILNKILSSFVNGNEDAINLVSKELFDQPIPVKLRLQLVHGKTKEFMEQLSDIVDSTVCSLS